MRNKSVFPLFLFYFYEEGKERKGKALKGEDEVRSRSRRSSSPIINEEKRRVKNGATRV